MIDAIFAQPNYAATKKMLDASALRHEAIASNIANLETPNYKRIDLDPSFSANLQQALGIRDLSRIQSLKPATMVDSSALASNRDGNTVNLESELLQLNQNTISHTVEIQMISGALLKMRLAITGRS